jgi:hypothetical protein
MAKRKSRKKSDSNEPDPTESHRNRPLSLQPMSFDEAVDKLLKAKPKGKQERRKG